MKHAPGSSARPDWPLAVVFGAGGLGMAVARRLGLRHRLLIADRDSGHLERQVEALVAAGHDVTGQCCDVTSPEDMAALMQRAVALGRVRSLAYVVGLSPSLGDFAAIMKVNLVGAARALLLFREVIEPGGAALCVSSSSAHMRPIPEEALPLLDAPLADGFDQKIAQFLGDNANSANGYMLSKQGVIRLCKREARDWGARGARVLSLSPGLIATPQGKGEYRNSPGKMKLFETIPLQRECTMLEIAGVVDFLLSDQASYITGTDILVDGGLISANF